MPKNQPHTSTSAADQRILLHIPIVHTDADLGGMAESIRVLSMQRMGIDGSAKKDNLIDLLWNRIEAFFDDVQLPYHRVRLFQDGLPVCGKEIDIVNDLARAGSRNHRLINTLISRGAELMGTESGDLLLREYALAQKLLASLSDPDPKPVSSPQRKAGQALLQQRDRFIARRITQNLESGNMGILFLGLLHDIAPYLADDIRIIHPLAKEN